jgi:Terminase RNaseH-like domain/Terminase large subunit, T4likevirus-type, N-terminal
MNNIKSRIKNLENKLKKNQSINSIDIPKNWQEFAPLTRIKSGKGFCQFNPYDYQELISELINKHSYLLIVKGRQLGCSETVISIALHQCLIEQGKSCLIISKSLQDTFSLGKRVRDMVLSLQSLKLVVDSLSEMKFDNGSSLYFRAGEQSGRGLPSCSFVIFDEFSFYKAGIDELAWSAALPSTEMLDGAEKVIILSTPNGRQNLYYKFLTEGNNQDILKIIDEVRENKHKHPPFIIDNSGWVKLILHFSHHPIYSSRNNYLEWIRKRKKISLNQVSREYDLSFADGETSWIDENLVYPLACGNWKNESDTTCKYYAGLDTATTGNDYLVFLIIEKNPNGKKSVVAMHRGRKSNFEKHISKIKRLIEVFKPIHGCVEVNGAGRLYYERFITEFSSTHWHEIKNNSSTRPLMIEKLRIAIENADITFPAGIIAEEILSLEDIEGKVQAKPGKHDDTIFSLIFALMASEKTNNIWTL